LVIYQELFKRTQQMTSQFSEFVAKNV